MRRSYRTADEVTPQLEQLIMELRSSGEKFLPSERRLQEQVGASRMTLRKSLEVLENRGLLAKGAGGRMIERGKHSPTCTVAIVAAGWEYPSNPVWFRLTRHLAQCLTEAGIAAREVYFGWNDPDEIWPGPLAEPPEYIVFTDTPNDKIRQRLLSLSDRCTLISTDEDYIGKVRYVVSLNNYHAGKTAGEALLRHGAVNPACIYVEKNYLPFIRRRDGFIDAVKTAGLSPENRLYPMRCNESTESHSYVQELIARTQDVIAAGHDALFLYDDASVRITYDLIAAGHRIPGEFSLVTLDGVGDSRKGNLLVNAVSHRAEETAQELVRLLTRMIHHQPHEKITLIDTEVLHGTTIKQ